jgi:fibronectin type 3 domain-containing protein
VVWESQYVDDTKSVGDWNIAGSNLDASPAVPTGVTAVGRSVGVVLEWSANTEPDIAGYNVYRSGSPEGAYVKLNESGVLTTPAYSDTSAPSGTVSYYRITAVDEAGNESAQSAAVRGARFGL